ncbi:MAG: hypothetical protein V3T59_08485 [Desulfobacterales bacterium]
MSPEHSEVEFFNFSAASRRTLQIVPTISSEVQTLVNRNIFMTTSIDCSIFNFNIPDNGSCRSYKYVSSDDRPLTSIF